MLISPVPRASAHDDALSPNHHRLSHHHHRPSHHHHGLPTPYDRGLHHGLCLLDERRARDGCQRHGESGASACQGANKRGSDDQRTNLHGVTSRDDGPRRQLLRSLWVRQDAPRCTVRLKRAHVPAQPNPSPSLAMVRRVQPGSAIPNTADVASPCAASHGACSICRYRMGTGRRGPSIGSVDVCKAARRSRVARTRRRVAGPATYVTRRTTIGRRWVARP